MAREQYTRNLSDFLILFIQVSTTHTNVFPLKVFASLLKVVSPEGYFFLQPGNLTKSRAITNFSNKKKRNTGELFVVINDYMPVDCMYCIYFVLVQRENSPSIVQDPHITIIIVHTEYHSGR